MSLLKTKPRWFPSAVATNRGWVNPANNEVLVAIGNLAELIKLEEAQTATVEIKVQAPIKAVDVIVEVAPILTQTVELEKEDEQKDVEEVQPVKKKAGRPKKIITETTPETTQNIIND